jgi:intein-encoded DNA endonuclease-like protein
MVKLGIPRRQRKEAWELAWRTKRDSIILNNSFAHIDKVRYEPNLSPSPDLAYIVGVYLGDGSAIIKKNAGRYIEYEVHLWTVDECFAEKFANALQRIGLRTYFIRGVRNNKPYCMVKVYSKRLYEYLTSIKLSKRGGLISFNLDKLKEIAEAHPIPFIEGFYESEGALAKYESSHGLRYTLAIANTNKELMFYLKDLLNRLGFDFHLYKESCKSSRHSVYQLALCKQAQIEKFFSLIHPCINRKVSQHLRNKNQ